MPERLKQGPEFDVLGDILETLATEAKAFPAASCNGCHAGAAADDWVFTQYYPVLRAGKAAGEEGTGGKRSDLSEEK